MFKGPHAKGVWRRERAQRGRPISLIPLPILAAFHCLTHVASIIPGSCIKRVFKTHLFESNQTATNV